MKNIIAEFWKEIKSIEERHSFFFMLSETSINDYVTIVHQGNEKMILQIDEKLDPVIVSEVELASQLTINVETEKFTGR